MGVSPSFDGKLARFETEKLKTKSRVRWTIIIRSEYNVHTQIKRTHDVSPIGSHGFSTRRQQRSKMAVNCMRKLGNSKTTIIHVNYLPFTLPYYSKLRSPYFFQYFFDSLVCLDYMCLKHFAVTLVQQHSSVALPSGLLEYKYTLAS